MDENTPLTDKKDLIRYLMQVHELEKNLEISRIKLQKGLYFLYAFWIDKLVETRNSFNEEKDLSDDMSYRLFDANFIAWSYGPVDREVYDDHKDANLKPFTLEESESFINKLNDNNPLVAQYIYSMTRRIINTSDFGLVDLTHRDSSWRNNYDASDPFTSKSITHEEIAADYGAK